MTFTTKQAADLTGATLRQLQWWDEHDIVRADRDGRAISGAPRAYTFDHLVRIAYLVQLRAKRVQISAFRNLAAMLPTDLDSYVLVSGLTWDSRLRDLRIYASGNGAKIADAAARSSSPVLVVSLPSEIRSRLERARRGP